MAGALLPDCLLLCPMSGQEAEDPSQPGVPKLVGEHFMIATTCKTGKGIFVRCPYHMFNGFLTHPFLVARYTDNGSNGKTRKGK
jgi:hypothetical protein